MGATFAYRKHVACETKMLIEWPVEVLHEFFSLRHLRQALLPCWEAGELHRRGRGNDTKKQRKSYEKSTKLATEQRFEFLP
jgi:hypothetical protein